MASSKNSISDVVRVGNITIDFQRTKHHEYFTTSQCEENIFQMSEFFRCMFEGKIVNRSESRKALHFLARSADPEIPENSAVQSNQEFLITLLEKFEMGELLNSRGKKFKYVVNIGIGGSHLGPKVVHEIFKTNFDQGIYGVFVSNIDPDDFHSKVSNLNPDDTFFVICTKTFTTKETLVNFELAKKWLEDHGRNWTSQCLAVTSNPELASELGFARDLILAIDENIGGRYSISSPMSVSLGLCFGSKFLKEFQTGFAFVDSYLKTNINSLNAIYRHALEIWLNCEQLESKLLAILPYFESGNDLPAMLQQLFMESLGKHVDTNGMPVGRAGVAIIGAAGTGAQHSFMQMLHQGTDLIAVDFILIKPLKDRYLEQREILFNNGLAQAEALWLGDASSISQFESAAANFKKVKPGKPSTVLVLDFLSPNSIGQLIAWYEHVVVALGALWDVNPFDQWGVELGKNIAKSLEQVDIQPSSRIQYLLNHLQ